MNREFGMITALLVLLIVLCVGGTAMCKEKRDTAQENERYALLENDFSQRAKKTLEEQGYRNSGLTVTWTRDRGGRRSYRVEVHHRRILAMEAGEQARLTELLRSGEFCKEVDDLSIVYY